MCTSEVVCSRYDAHAWLSNVSWFGWIENRLAQAAATMSRFGGGIWEKLGNCISNRVKWQVGFCRFSWKCRWWVEFFYCVIVGSRSILPCINHWKFELCHGSSALRFVLIPSRSWGHKFRWPALNMGFSTLSWWSAHALALQTDRTKQVYP